ncbi:winged helix-turn-helix transcriptional regulator [Nonomuraea dietziae]|uniref:DNA-binding HxlR family transcriptional regulator n=1 Tax=Nonomuraea dietziae TaxID=65515 RepID=A0A7W5VHX3_9ACTN|nr:helix-turn-helix domain-containing protein [Nonomuraea dietziae]MBB3733925.1 DNA-binding HxlR family transcriptional regulator [Nonomuraea dietziae]
MSSFDRPGDVFLADCPARLAVEILSDKWALVTVYALGNGPRRHGELKALIGGISSKMLTQTLRRLQHHGLVHRQAFAEVPPRVEYALTDLGQSALEPVDGLRRWAEQNGDAVLAAHDGRDR